MARLAALRLVKSMSNFLRSNDFQLIFRGSYKRIENQKNMSIGRWKAKRLENSSDKIIGFAKFSRSEVSDSFDYGAVYIDSHRNGVYDAASNESDLYDKRIPTSYRSLDRTKKMLGMKKGKVKVWFGEKAKIPYLSEYADGYYKIRITDKSSGEYYDYDSYKLGFERTLSEVFGIELV